MSEIHSSDEGITKSAGLQLLWFAFLAVGGLALLMYLLSWATQATSSGVTGNFAVDAPNKTISVFLEDEPPQLNTIRSTDAISARVLGHLNEGLLRYDEKNQLVPGVATRWEIDDQGATFYLREDAKWADGVPVTANDFVFSWRQVVDPASASEFAFIIYPVKNAEAINKGEMSKESLGVKAISDLVLKITFERPIAYFHKLVAAPSYYPVRQDFFESTKGRHGADADELLSNGPFMLTSWVHGSSMRMERNPHYWDQERIYLDAINIPYITKDKNTTFNLFEAGSIAFAELSEENLNGALDKRWHIHQFQEGTIFYIEFNHRDGRLTKNFNLRKAMQLATDSAELVYKVIRLPGYLPGTSLFPIGTRGVDDLFVKEYPPPHYALNVKEARRHLALAKKELGLKEWPQLVLLTGDTEVSTKNAEYYQAVFKKNLGLDVKIDKQIFKQRLAKMTSGEFDMVLAGWGADFDDPITFGDLFASWNLNNRGRFSSPDLDAQVRIAQNSLDPRTRMNAIGEIQSILLDDVVIIPDYERGKTYVTDPRMQGMVRRSVGPDPDWTNVRIVD